MLWYQLAVAMEVMVTGMFKAKSMCRLHRSMSARLRWWFAQRRFILAEAGVTEGEGGMAGIMVAVTESASVHARTRRPIHSS